VEVDGDLAEADLLQEGLLEPEDGDAEPEGREFGLAVHEHAGEGVGVVSSNRVCDC
jgi:hypothetical protein